MEAKAYMKNVKTTPKKLRILLPAVKGLSPQEALEKLAYTPKTSARHLHKAVQTALATAKSLSKQQESEWRFKVLTVEEGQKLKRFRAGGRGMAKPYVRKYSHIKIVLESKELPKTADPKPKAIEKPKVKVLKVKSSKK